MAYPLIKQDGFQLPSPAHTASPKSTPDDDRDDHLFMPHNISFLPEPFRKFPAQAHPHHPAHHPQPIDFADELATLIETPHVPSHERSTHSRSPNDDTYRHNIFDISAPAPAQHHQDFYQPDFAHFGPSVPTLNSSIRYEPHPDPSGALQYRHTPSPTHRSRSRSRAPSVGPTRSARRDRRTNSISSPVSSTSPPPRPHPHAIVIPGRGNAMGGFFVPNGASAPPDYNLPTPDSLSHSFGIQHTHPHAQPSQFPYPAQTPSSPYYGYPPVNRAGTPSMGISPTDVEALNNISINGIATQHLASSLPASHVSTLTKPAVASGPVTSAAKQLDPDTHLSEKRRRRRESHNAVERRRRDNINERISELAGLIPGVLFECDGPLAVPGTTPSATGPTITDDLFSIGVLGDTGMHVMPAEEGLPDLPEEGSMVKKDPSEEGEVLTPTSPATASVPDGNVNGATANSTTTNASGNEQTMIKANKGMILRKSVEYIRYLQQLVSVQASRGRDLEERNRILERELVMLRGDVGQPSSLPSTSSSSPSVVSSGVFSMASSIVSTASSQPSSMEESHRAVEHCGENPDDEMDDGSEMGERTKEGVEDAANELRGRQLNRARDKVHSHGLGLGEEVMDI